ncbi:MAG: hypothetical protein JW797_06755 [Bradymonadales bacterium]|nr:hypothetical protein [Bradymonadales bacterium]
MAVRDFFEKLSSIDRRWIFLLIALAVVIPSAFEIKFKELPTPEVLAIFDRIENLPERSKVLLSFDFDPPSEPELLPMAFGLIRHLALNNQRIYMIALWPMGQAEARKVVDPVFGYGAARICQPGEEHVPTPEATENPDLADSNQGSSADDAPCVTPEFPDYVYGTDYVMLGYQPGGAGVIRVIINDIRGLYTVDAANTPVDSLPMMREVVNLRDMDLLLNLSAGDTNKYWIQFGGDPTGIPVAGGVTAVSAPLLYPYYPRQMFGILGGLKAAAEYESLLIERYQDEQCHADPVYREQNEHCQRQIPMEARFPAIERMGPQTFAHLVIILFILIGNAAFFLTRGRRRLVQPRAEEQ